MFEFAAVAANGYGPNIVGALISGVLTGVFAGLVALCTARHEVAQERRRLWRETRARRQQEQRERREREQQEKLERRDALNRQVVSGFAAAVSALVRGFRPGEAEQFAEDLVWAQSRTVQMKILLHSHERQELLMWFNEAWAGLLRQVEDCCHRERFTQVWGIRGEISLLWDIQTQLMSMESIFLRWAIQPIEEWDTEKPPEELLTAYPQVAADGSEDGGE